MISKTKFLPLVSFSFILVACASAPKVYAPQRPWQKNALMGAVEKSVEAFGTKVVVRVWPSNKLTVTLDQAADAAIAEIQRVEKLTDETVSDSEVSQINKKAYKEAVPVSEELAKVLIEADRMYKMSDGRFDVTYTPYKNERDFTDDDYNRITDWDQKEPLNAKALRLFGDKNFILDTDPSHRVRRYNQRIRLNLKGMARGYAAQKAVQVLSAQNLGGFAVIADGFFAAAGSAFKDAWLMCIENPKALGECLYRITPMSPGKVLYVGTSASQERIGKMFDAKEGWSYRSGGVVVAGENGAWVQFATTVTAVMDDLVLNSFFKKMQNPQISGVYFIKNNQNGKLDGTMEPFAVLMATDR